MSSPYPRRDPDVGGYIECARPGAERGRITITTTERQFLVESLTLAIDDTDRFAQRLTAHGRRSMPPQVIRAILWGLVGALSNGVIHDDEQLHEWRLRHGTMPTNARPRRVTARAEASSPIDSDEVIRLREQVNAERDAEQPAASLIERMIG